MKNKTYDVLKIIALIVLPAIATLYSGLAEVWGLPCADQIPTTIMLFDTFLGTVLQISSNNYQKKVQG